MSFCFHQLINLCCGSRHGYVSMIVCRNWKELVRWLVDSGDEFLSKILVKRSEIVGKEVWYMNCDKL